MLGIKTQQYITVRYILLYDRRTKSRHENIEFNHMTSLFDL